jgi:hypothetical protein
MRMDGNIVVDIGNKQLWPCKNMEEERLPKHLLELQAEGRRLRGRPAMTWKEDVARAMSQRLYG